MAQTSPSQAIMARWGVFVMSIALLLIQLAVTVVMGVYFVTQLRKERQQKPQIKRESGREMENLRRMRAIRLSEPLAERVRPASMRDIVGQEDGIRSLMAILCGKHPQHVLIYGPPGVGKTCAARLVLEAAKKSADTPFRENAPFIEMDATCVRFDERAIADPLIGSVHDPIYQGAGQLGAQGIPQPKPGAVSRAHGGVLFLDEIGEMHPIQMNKLLKVLEDRKVMFESAYYHPDDAGIPRHIHEIFKMGMPADFRLVGATTRSPEDMPPALRSRCMEIFFRDLTQDEVSGIARNAATRAGFEMDEDTARFAGRFAACGRDAVNMVQMAAGVAQMDGRQAILREDMEWVVQSGHYAPRQKTLAARESRVGAVHALAVSGARQGTVMDIEAVCVPGSGRLLATGVVDEEELGAGARTLRRQSTARGACANVATLLRGMKLLPADVDVHINFPGGAPVDGPSAGVAIALAAVSALSGRAVDGESAVTGEISLQGRVMPVGGVPLKVEAAKNAGLTRVLVPKEDYLKRFTDCGIIVSPVEKFSQAIDAMLLPTEAVQTRESAVAPAAQPLAAAGK